ncbi:MAG: hypothetical protein AB7Q01_08360 [Gammaproteobacteria bacterium]
MTPEIVHQISEVAEKYQGLTTLIDSEVKVLLSGNLVFEASVDGLPSFTESFDIEIAIPSEYPAHLPSARETAGKLDPAYEHLYTDGTFCLAVPLEERRIFNQAPTLLGFIDNLVIPYLYSYRYKQRFGIYPFGDQPHGHAGIVKYYQDTLDIADDIALIAVISALLEYGYRGHHLCPCGSDRSLRSCHGEGIRRLAETHTIETLRIDFVALLSDCGNRLAEQGKSLPTALMRQVQRIIGPAPT